MEKREWEDLNEDVLVNALAKVGLESLLFDIPFVCKSWYKVTLNPLCWQCFAMPTDRFRSRLEGADQIKGLFDTEDLIKFVGKRSRKSVTTVVLPFNCTKEELVCVAEEFTALKSLVLPSDIIFYEGPFGLPSEMPLIASLMSKWKNLEFLTLGCGLSMEIILSQISHHCKNFIGLEVEREPIIGKDRASAIVSLLPNLQYLVLKKASIERKSLVIILRGCKKLVHLDVSDCNGFSVDEEILKLASRITKFEYDGARERCLWDYVEDDFFYDPLSDYPRSY